MYSNTTFGVVHGGLSYEREKSLQYGKKVSKILEELGMNVVEMHLHPNGSWTVNGQVTNVEEAIKKTDKVWNCLVGVDGESGVVEELCQKCKVKLVGHTHIHSCLAGDKKNMQYALNNHKIKSPFGKVILKKDYSLEKLKETFSTVPFPAIIKPLSGSGAWGVKVASNFSEFEKAVEFLIAENKDVLVEKVITGTLVSCFVFEYENLLHTHIKVHGDENVSRDDFMKIRNDALYIHSVLAFPHHVEYQFILSPKGLYFIEANTHPSLVSDYIKDSFGNGAVSLKEYITSRVK